VEKKISKLGQYHDRIIKVDVFLKLDNVVHNIKDKVAEIKVHVPRHDFFVKHCSKSFEESFDIALDSVITQIKRKKQKIAA
jgi:putative sigma-54 modulation protein